MSESPTSGGETLPVDAQEFTGLFVNVPENRDKIWGNIVTIVQLVADQLQLDRIHPDAQEIKGDGLTHAMSKLDSFDPARGNPYSYFFKIVQRRMTRAAKAKRPKLLGDADSTVCFHDLYEADAGTVTHAARRNCPNNWRSFQLTCKLDRELARKHFATCLRRARQARTGSRSKGEKAAVAVIIETLKQSRRALLG